jgi:hypothetical protein
MEPASDSGLLLAGEQERHPLSEDGAVGLVRLVGRRRLPRRAGASALPTSPAAGLLPIGGWADRGWHSNNRSPFLVSLPRRLPRAHGRTQSQLGAEQAAGVSGGFHNASIEARNGCWDYGDDRRKVPFSRNFSSGANGIEPVTSCLQSRTRASRMRILRSIPDSNAPQIRLAAASLMPNLMPSRDAQMMPNPAGALRSAM